MPKPDEGWSPITKLNQETCLQGKVDFYGQRAEVCVWETGLGEENFRCTELSNKEERGYLSQPNSVPIKKKNTHENDITFFFSVLLPTMEKIILF